MENLYPPPPFQIKDGEMARFGFRGASSLIFGGGGLLFHLSEIAGGRLFEAWCLFNFSPVSASS